MIKYLDLQLQINNNYLKYFLKKINKPNKTKNNKFNNKMRFYTKIKFINK